MAELEMSNDSLFNMMKAKAPSGELLDLTYRMVEKEPVLRDVPTYPANNGMTHYGFRWINEITATVSVVGGGWTSSCVQGQDFTEDMILVRSRYQVSIDRLVHMGNGAARWRAAQEEAHMKGTQRSWTSTIIRGDASTGNKKINGLAKRAPWNVLTDKFCEGMGGSGNRRSMWLVCPGPANFHLIYNKDNPTLGVKREVQPKQLIKVSDYEANGSGERWDSFTDFEFEQGICVYNDMAIKRICNIDYTATPTRALINKIMRLRHIHANYLDGQWFLWCDPEMYVNLVNLAGSEMNVQYSSENPYRKSLPMIADIIIRNIEALNYDDDLVAAP